MNDPLTIQETLSIYNTWNSYKATIKSCKVYLLCVNEYAYSHNHIRLFATPRTAAHQAPLSMGFSRREYWSGLPFPSQGIFSTQGSNLGLLHCQWVLYQLSHQGSPNEYACYHNEYDKDQPLNSPEAPRDMLTEQSWFIAYIYTQYFLLITHWKFMRR